MAEDRIDENGLPVYAPGDYDFVRVVDRSTGASRNALAPEVTAAARALSGALGQVVADAEADIAPVIAGLGYLPPVPYASGLVVDSTRLTVIRDGQVYAPAAPVPFTTAAWDAGQWRLVQGVVASDLSAGTGAGMVGVKQSFPGAFLRSLADWFSDEVSVMDFVPLSERVRVRLRTSTADLSPAFQAANDFAASRGGMRVKVPSGTYPNVQGITLSPGVIFEGDGQASTIIKMPSSPSDHMFKAPALASFDGGGLIGVQLDGGKPLGSATFHGLDFSACSSLEEFVIDLCYIHGFNRGFNGSLGEGGLGNDRFPTIRSSRFWGNSIGIFTNEHGIISFCDVRANDIGLSGRINDLHCIYVKFTYNRVGCIGNPNISNSGFTNCTWYRNTEMAAELSTSVTVVGGVACGVNDPSARGGLGDIGFRLRSSASSIIGVKFGQAAQPATCFADTCVLIERDSIAQVQHGNSVQNCIMHLDGDGIGVRSRLGSQLLYGGGIDGNFVRSAGNPFLELESFRGLNVTANRIHLKSDVPEGEAVISWSGTVGASAETSTFALNQFTSDETSPSSTLFKGNAANIAILYNQVRSFSSPFSLTNIRAAKVEGNSGYRNRNSGVVTIPSGATSATVLHGLSLTPELGDIQLTPNDNMLGIGYWVSGVTSTYITINVSPAAGKDLKFSWSAMLRGGSF